MAARGRTIVITGISRGCGRALAEYYLARGHRVAGCARSPSIIWLKGIVSPDVRERRKLSRSCVTSTGLSITLPQSTWPTMKR